MTDLLNNELIEAFQKSGMSIDEFIANYLAEKGVANPGQVVNELNNTLTGIDKNYEELKKHKAAGKDRASFLRNVCDKVAESADAQKAGEAFTILIDALNEEESSGAKAAPFESVDAVNYMKKLEEAITKDSLKNFSEGE